MILLSKSSKDVCSGMFSDKVETKAKGLSSTIFAFFAAVITQFQAEGSQVSFLGKSTMIVVIPSCPRIIAMKVEAMASTSPQM